MNLQTALALTFEQYIRWCHEFCRQKVDSEPLAKQIYNQQTITFLEAMWAKRYWFHHCNQLNNKE